MLYLGEMMPGQLIDENSISVLGVGGGGHAFAVFAKSKGFKVNLWNRTKSVIDGIKRNGGITATGMIEGHFQIDLATTSIKDAINESQLLMIVTTADAHKEIAEKIAPYLNDKHIIVLNPGRTGGALEVSNTITNNHGPNKPRIVEAQSMLFVSRSEKPGKVIVSGIKKRLPISAFPATLNEELLLLLKDLHPSFCETESVLNTSFDNIGAIFHPAPLLLNVARCENPQVNYLHYIEGVSPSVAFFLEEMDKERINVAKAYDVNATSLKKWLNLAYGSKGNNLYELIQNTKEYQNLIAPSSLNVRYIFEEVPTGLVPISNLGKAIGVPTPNIDTIINLANCLMKTDYRTSGRTLESMGIDEIPIRLLPKYVKYGKEGLADIRDSVDVLEE